MKKTRFFALLHFARQLNREDKLARHILLNTFLIGYNTGWNARN